MRAAQLVDDKRWNAVEKFPHEISALQRAQLVQVNKRKAARRRLLRRRGLVRSGRSEREILILA
jgi:hypothetical protein